MHLLLAIQGLDTCKHHYNETLAKIKINDYKLLLHKSEEKVVEARTAADLLGGRATVDTRPLEAELKVARITKFQCRCLRYFAKGSCSGDQAIKRETVVALIKEAQSEQGADFKWQEHVPPPVVIALNAILMLQA